MQLGCFCYLLRHTDKDVKDILGSLDSLYQNFLKDFSYPIYIFHEQELTLDMQKSIITFAQKNKIRLYLRCLKFNVPKKGAEKLKGFKLGYSHMCQFFAAKIFNRPELQAYTYYCRLDSDSRILSPIKYDIFKYMETNSYQYGFITLEQDKIQYSSGLWPAIKTWIRQHHVTPLQVPFAAIKEGVCYYTNFELCKISWFKQGYWLPYIDTILKDGGIYRERWGDHTIRYLGLLLFMPAKYIHQFLDIHYLHHKEYNRPHRK